MLKSFHNPLRIVLVVFAILVMCSAASFAAGRGHGGGGRGGGGGHGGGGHGGGMHMGGRGGGGAHFGGARMGGARQFAAPRAVARPRGGGGVRSFAGRRGGGNRFVNRAVRTNSSTRNARINNGGNRNAGTRTLTNRAAAQNLRANSARSNAVRNALNSRSFAGALRNRNALHNPAARNALLASAATAGWQGRNRGGWWRHGHGGYGWVGPLFWPFAYNDLYDYAWWGYDYDPSFWDYGYGDIYAGLFAPYGYDALAGYGPASTGPRRSTAPSDGAAQNETTSAITPMCGDDTSDIAGLPIDRIQQTINPNDEQRAALDALGNASVQAAQTIRSACPAEPALTAPARLAAMEKRIQAMIDATSTLQPPLEKFYGLLNDDQKAKLVSLNERPSSSGTAPQDANCGIASMPDAMAWPTDEINQRLQPTDAQKAKLNALQDATFKAASTLKDTCQPSTALTPPARLNAVNQRLNALLGAVTSVHAALDDFYGTLSDEQKAQFEAIGPARGGTQVSANDDGDQAPAAQNSRRSRRHSRGHGIYGVERAVRGILSIVR